MSKRQFRIALMREYAGLSQQEVADALGIKKARYGDWERETREINLRDAIKLADLFHCTLDELAGREFRAPERNLIQNSSEQTVVDGYRMADEGQQFMMVATAKAVIEKAEAEALEKKAGNAAG